MRHKMKPGYLRYFFSLPENCKQTSDWFRLFRFLRRLRKGVTNKECCGTMSLYGIWWVSFARGDTQSTALSVFFFSFFSLPRSLISCAGVVYQSPQAATLLKAAAPGHRTC